MARIRVDSSGIAEMRMSMEQQAQTMQRVEQAVGQVLANLDVKISSTDNIKQSLSSLKKSASKGREALFDMSGALTRVNDEFLSTDHAISEQARDINYAMDYIIADAAFGYKEGIPLDIQTKYMETGFLSELFGLSPVLFVPMMILRDPAGFFDGTSKAFSIIKDAGEVSEWIELFTDEERFGKFSDQLENIGKDTCAKVVGYLADGKKLVDAVNAGDLSTIEDLSEKYLKKGTKLGIGLATGVKVTGVVYSVYLDLGWHFGENVVESVRDFAEEPSITSLFSGIWNITAGTFFDAGTGLAEDALSFVGDITGKEFDSEDFREAMDYLWNHPFKSAYATGEVIVEGIASAGETIANGVGWAVEKIGDSASSLLGWL